jgi:hypothetical protein
LTAPGNDLSAHQASLTSTTLSFFRSNKILGCAHLV